MSTVSNRAYAFAMSNNKPFLNKKQLCQLGLIVIKHFYNLNPRYKHLKKVMAGKHDGFKGKVYLYPISFNEEMEKVIAQYYIDHQKEILPATKAS